MALVCSVDASLASRIHESARLWGVTRTSIRFRIISLAPETVWAFGCLKHFSTAAEVSAFAIFACGELAEDTI